MNLYKILKSLATVVNCGLHNMEFCLNFDAQQCYGAVTAVI